MTMIEMIIASKDFRFRTEFVLNLEIEITNELEMYFARPTKFEVDLLPSYFLKNEQKICFISIY